MILGSVESGEVIIIVFDFVALKYLKAHTCKNVDKLVYDKCIGVESTDFFRYCGHCNVNCLSLVSLLKLDALHFCICLLKTSDCPLFNFVYDLKSCKLPRKQHLKEVCEVVKIWDVGHRLIKNLSKGYRQRVGIAQALIGNPKVLIFDEPTIGLDPRQIIEIRNLIKMLGREHTIILSTHILSEVQAVCDRIVVINKGKIVADEKTEDLINAVDGSRKMIAKIVGPEDEVLKALRSLGGIKSADMIGKRDTDSVSYIIESQDRVDVRKPLFYMLSSKGWPLVGLEGVELSLEDIFMRLVGKEKDAEKTDKSDKKAEKKSGKGGNK